MAKSKLLDEVVKYSKDIVDGKINVNKDRRLATERFLRDMENTKYELRTESAEFVVKIIENTFVHIKGPLRGKPFKLEMWQKFICVNVAGFYYKGKDERRFKESFIYIPRKNGKTSFAAALAWAIALLDRLSNAIVYIVATKMDRALEAFDIIAENIEMMGEKENFKIKNNNAEHSISRGFYNQRGEKIGALRIQALAADAKRADGLNAPIFILDEIHAYKNANEYYVYKQAMKAYVNKMLIGITTAGENMSSFCYQRLCYCQEILAGTKEDEEYFIFIAMADDPNDYTNPIQHEIANPNYGLTIREQDIMNDALQAQNDPTGKVEFLNKSLNVYVDNMNSYFNVYEVQESDKENPFTIENLAKLPIKWYGGADLSKMHDLTGTALHGRYKDIDIAITHGFMPITSAMKKAEEDNIPFFLWKDRGWLTLCNSDVIDYEDPVKWFIQMRDMGFKIRWVGYDRRYSREFVLKMRKAGFNTRDQSQRYVEKTEAFREIEKQIKRKRFAYLGNKAFEYCIGNVKAIEDSDDFVRFEKVMPTRRIDLFDADVIACKQMLIDLEKSKKTEKWFE